MGTSPWDIQDNLQTSGSPPSKRTTFLTEWYTGAAFLWTFLHVCLQRWASVPPGQRSCVRGSPHLPSRQMSPGCSPKWDAAQPYTSRSQQCPWLHSPANAQCSQAKLGSFDGCGPGLSIQLSQITTGTERGWLYADHNFTTLLWTSGSYSLWAFPHTYYRSVFFWNQIL